MVGVHSWWLLDTCFPTNFILDWQEVLGLWGRAQHNGWKLIILTHAMAEHMCTKGDPGQIHSESEPRDSKHDH